MWDMKRSTGKKVVGALAIVAVAGLVVAWSPGENVLAAPEDGAPHPANKIAVAGSSLAEMQATPGKRVVTLFSESLKTSSPTDLILSVDAECSIITNIFVMNDQTSEAIGTVKVWVEVDGKTVAVSPDDAVETGRVVFCNRAFKAAIFDLEDDDARFEYYLSTRSTHGFSWITMDVGNGVHSIAVKAELETSVTGQGEAAAAVLKRTLVVDPVKLANDETL